MGKIFGGKFPLTVNWCVGDQMVATFAQDKGEDEDPRMYPAEVSKIYRKIKKVEILYLDEEEGKKYDVSKTQLYSPEDYKFAMMYEDLEKEPEGHFPILKTHGIVRFNIDVTNIKPTKSPVPPINEPTKAPSEEEECRDWLINRYVYLVGGNWYRDIRTLNLADDLGILELPLEFPDKWVLFKFKWVDRKWTSAELPKEQGDRKRKTTSSQTANDHKKKKTPAETKSEGPGEEEYDNMTLAELEQKTSPASFLEMKVVEAQFKGAIKACPDITYADALAQMTLGDILSETGKKSIRQLFESLKEALKG